MFECKATLRVKSDVLSLADICVSLGKPASGFSKGQEYGKAKRLRKHTQWSFVVGEQENLSMQQCLLKICDFWERHDIRSIVDKIHIDVFCMLSSDNGQGSFSLEPTVLQRLLNTGLIVTFDFYSD